MPATADALSPAGIGKMLLSQRSGRILIVTGTSPGEPGVGGVILRDLVNAAGVENVHCCWLTSTRQHPPHYMENLSTSFHTRRYEAAWRPVPGILGEVVSRSATGFLRSRVIRVAVRDVETAIKAFRPVLILVVLESIAAIEVAVRLSNRTSVPLHGIVWDDVDTFCDHGQVDRWTRSVVRRNFGEALRGCRKIAVICENMQMAYKQRYGVESEVLRHGMPQCEPQAGVLRSVDRVWTIGFAGSITTPDCIQSLFRVLDKMEWKLNGNDVRLRMLGARYVLGTRNRQWIEYLGWRDVQETRDLLHQCDVLYLPQTFAAEKRYFSELSFPTKLSTYVAASTPILLHAPQYASLSSFWSQYEMGPQVSALDSNSLLAGLEAAFSAPVAQTDRWLHNIQTVFHQVLSVERFRAGVADIITPHTKDAVPPLAR